jgi:hypothetical protein
MNSIFRNKKLIFILLVSIFLVIFTVIFIFKPTEEEQIDRVRIELLTTFKENSELFKSIPNFVLLQEGDIFAVSKPFKATSGLVAISESPHKVLELDQKSDTYKKMDQVINQIKFDEIIKNYGLVRFVKQSSYNVEQGIIFSPNGEKPKNMHTELLEEKWYYYTIYLE